MDYEKVHKPLEVCLADFVSAQLMILKHIEFGGEITEEQFNFLKEMLERTIAGCQFKEAVLILAEKARKYDLHVDRLFETSKDTLC